MNPIATIFAIAKDENTLRLIFALMQEHLASVREKGRYISKPAGLDDWVKLEINGISTSGSSDDDSNNWDTLLETCGSEIGENGAVFVVFSYPDTPEYVEYESSSSNEDLIYSEDLEELKEYVTDAFDDGERLYRWFAVEAGFLSAESADLTDNESSALPLKWSVGRKEPYVKSVDHAQTKVVFPTAVGKTAVTGIADKFEFKNSARRTVEEVIIPEGYVYIGEKAFSECPKLKKVMLPSTLASIGEHAFSYCPKLESITIPGSLKEISRFAFTNCKSLKELVIQDGVESIELAAFSECVKLTEIVIPDSMKSIDAGAFENCSGLKHIKIPDGVEIEGAAFKGCKKLANKDGMVIMDNKLIDYTGTEENVVIPQGIREIGASAFSNNLTIKSITMPDSVKVIGPCAFMWCTNLEEMTVPGGVEKISRLTFCNCHSLRRIDIPDTVKEIGEDAFIGCFMLLTVDLPESVQSVGAHAFSDSNQAAGSITVVIRNPDTVLHSKCLEGCKNFTIYTLEGSKASQFSPSRTKPLQEYTGA